MAVEQPICGRFIPERMAPLSLDGHRGNRVIFPTTDASDKGIASKALYSAREVGGRRVYVESYIREPIPLREGQVGIARSGFTIERWFDPKEKEPLHLHAALTPTFTEATSVKINELFSSIPLDFSREIIEHFPKLRFCSDEGIIFEGDDYRAIQIDTDNRFILDADLETYEPVWQRPEDPFRINLWNPPYFYEHSLAEFKMPNGVIEIIVAGFYINKTEPKKIEELIFALTNGADLNERELREIMNPYLRVVHEPLFPEDRKDEPGKVDCLSHEVLREDSWISLDGPSPKGIVFTCEWRNPNNGKPNSKFDKILNKGSVRGEDGSGRTLGEDIDEEEESDEEAGNSVLAPERAKHFTVQTATQSKEVYVEIKGSANPSEMLNSLLFPSGFVAEEFRTKKDGKLHHWDIAIAPQMDKRSQALAELTFSDLDDETREEAKEDLSEYWPMCSVGEGEGVTVSIGGKYVIEIGDEGSYMVVEGGIEEREEDGELELPFETFEMVGVPQVLNGHNYLRYQAEFELDDILPIEFEEGDEMASWKAVVGVYVRDLALGYIDSEIRQLLERGQTTQNDLSEYVIPYVKIVDPNLAEV